MENLLLSSVSEGSITSTDHSNELSDNNEDDTDLKIKQGDSISKETKQRLVGTLSLGQDQCKSYGPKVLEFEDSRAVLDAVYLQWLSEKKAKIKEKKIQETKSKSMLQNEEAKVIAKKEQLKADAVKAYDRWKMKKDEDLAKKLKMKRREKGTFTILIKHTGVANEPYNLRA